MSAERGINPKERAGARKPDLSLVPSAGIIHEAMAFEDGAKKYGAYNFRSSKIRAMVYIAAIERHLQEYKDGADHSNDTDPPVHQLAHIRACANILLDAEACGTLDDDRPPRGKATEILNQFKAQKESKK